ncbi:hypothetical protein MBM_03602 [Drepanopeziza brunnea f. sp. 'multigermtubi' MB_m1]|uniref:Retrotransposon gag domain-containing protein n=1 Tax=Marssonina brunnea f. sp. multigermtubi (strain MB_m1) TaxID=1072389 RepID=K1Y0H0_MARBU|nr:uncharacterized protein MBM_03602 [Drepanopeziza brunnea f. sp. 'multigermtubi' MB_m1]EKD18609.1 hypothetical protein MBM_03602 [Drepanopeziza brunnea f. sp. 'multigermtubi' MB_m1]
MLDYYDLLFIANEKDKRKCVLPDPDKFNGTVQRWNTWLPSIKAKLLVDGKALGGPTAQFYYVYFNMEPGPQAMVLTQLASAQDSAEDKLLACKQGTDALHIYVSRFERLLHAARYQTWPDANKIIAFRNGLNSTIRTRLNGQLTLPTTYTEYVHVTQQLGRSSGSSGLSGPSHGFSRPSAPSAPLQNRPRTSTGPPPGDPMDLSAIERAQQLEQLQHANELGAIELIDAHEANQTQLLKDRYPTLQHAPHSTLNQREAWRKSNRCTRCGAIDH